MTYGEQTSDQQEWRFSFKHWMTLWITAERIISKGEYFNQEISLNKMLQNVFMISNTIQLLKQCVCTEKRLVS